MGLYLNLIIFDMGKVVALIQVSPFFARKRGLLTFTEERRFNDRDGKLGFDIVFLKMNSNLLAFGH